MSELIERLRIVGGVGGEAADALEQQAKQIADLQRELNNERARGIHSCSPDCTRDGCVNRRLRAQIEELQAEITEQARLNGMGSKREAAKDARIAELAAALAVKNEALHALLHLWDRTRESGCLPVDYVKANAVLAIQPHASLVAKIKADAVRKLGIFFSSEGLNFSTFRQVALDYADRIEREEK